MKSKLSSPTNNSFVDIFLSDEDKEQFERDGYLVKNLLNQDEVAFLLEQYRLIYKPLADTVGVQVNLYDDDATYNKAVDKAIMGVMYSKLEGIFKNIDYLLANYIVKHPGNQSEVPPHQDWTFVDEERYYSINLWGTLVATNMDNGAIGVIPRSHKWFKSFRGTPHIPFPFAEHVDEVKSSMKILQMQAGDFLIYDHRLLHGSLANKTNIERVAIGVSIFPKDAQLIHCFQKQGRDGVLEIYKVDPTFFIGHRVDRRPPAENLLRTISYRPQKMPLPTLKKKLEGI